MPNGEICEGVFDDNDNDNLIEGKKTERMESGIIVQVGKFKNKIVNEGLIIKNNSIEIIVNTRVTLTTDVDKMIEFLNLNVDKIYISAEEIGTYKISNNQICVVKNNIIEYSGLNDEDKKDSILFLDRLMSIYRYIPFNEFIDKIKTISLEIIEFLINNHQNYEEILFIIKYSVKKSNTWISLLFLNELKSFLIDDANLIIKNKIKFLDTMPINMDISQKKKLLLMFDDMSYSGLQISSYINDNSYSINFDIYITLPYISLTAYDRIKKKNNNVMVWNSTEIMDTFYNTFTNHGMNERYKQLYDKFCINNPSKVNLKKGFQCNPKLIPVYFDHKIADFMSTFQKLLVFGLYPIDSTNQNSKCVISSLIEKCIPNDLTKINYQNKCDKYLENLKEKDACPKPIYKMLKYDFACDIKNVSDSDERTLVYLLKCCDVFAECKEKYYPW